MLRYFLNQGCDASVILTDSKGERSNFTERQAVPNRTLKGFDIIDLIKEEVEKACPGVVSCADILALATRDGILLVCLISLFIDVLFLSEIPLPFKGYQGSKIGGVVLVLSMIYTCVGV